MIVAGSGEEHLAALPGDDLQSPYSSVEFFRTVQIRGAKFDAF